MYKYATNDQGEKPFKKGSIFTALIIYDWVLIHRSTMLSEI